MDQHQRETSLELLVGNLTIQRDLRPKPLRVASLHRQPSETMALFAV